MKNIFSSDFIPKSYLYLRNGYTFATFRKDLLAGLTVGIIALPLAMAFAIASGVPPERGIFTAIVAGFIISALGGSRVQIGGPTGAFVVLIYQIIDRSGYTGLVSAMLVASVALIFLGVFRIGSWIRYVPHPLVVGFTTGIAVLIFSSQMKDFFGLQMATPPADFLAKWKAYFAAFSTWDPTTFGLSMGTFLLILAIRRFFPWVPWGIVAIFFATLVAILFHLPVATIYSQYGQIPRTLPLPHIPTLAIPLAKWGEIITDGLAIAFLGGIESLLSAVIGDGMIGGRHRSNCELIAQGIANFGSFLFGGIPATGAIARTAANIRTGAQTPVAGMIHAVTLFLILFLFAPLVSKIPLGALAAILIMVSWNMSEARHFFRILKAPFEDWLVLLTAFFLTVFVDITVAISAGMVLASFLFMKRMSQMLKAIPSSKVFAESAADFPEREDPEDLSKKEVPAGIEVYEIQGPLFFGAANIFRDLLSGNATRPKAFILRMRLVPLIDESGSYALEEFYRRCKKNNVQLLLSGVRHQTRKDLKKYGLVETIGEENIFPNINAALEKARTL